VHTGHPACQNVPKKEFPLKIYFSRTTSGVHFWKATEVLYFVCKQHLLAAYTFAVAASRLMRYKKLKF
jgi:hypothetical protein